jgi:spermidine synthase
MTRSPNATYSPPAIVMLGSVFIIAACGLVYELIAGAVSSYILGDAVTQFSLVIGVFLCAMGLGAYMAQFIRRNLLRTFIEIEIWIGLIGGTSSVIMFAVSAFAGSVFPVFFYCICIIIGVLIGIEIPLLVRILKESGGISQVLSRVLALDYMGALAGSILFPFLVLPYLGLSRASVVFGIMNLIIAGVGVTILKDRRKWIAMWLSAAAIVLFATLVYSARLVGFLEDVLYQDEIVYSRTTPYQRIVLTRWRDDIRLYLNGHLQFSSIDEARYHEALVLPAMEASGNARNVLILGGGDGMAAREVLKYPGVENIQLVDIDPAITELSSNWPGLRALNQDALMSPKVTIHNTDAMKYLEFSRDFFDVIIVDLPDPSNQTLAKLYSRSFYMLCLRRLSMGGVLTTQATSPFFAPDAFWCIVETIRAAYENQPGGMSDMYLRPYHVHVPSFGEWGFVMAARRVIEPHRYSPSVATRYLNKEALAAMFSFGGDMRPRESVEINRLDQPVLFTYYQRGWSRFNQ